MHTAQESWQKFASQRTFYSVTAILRQGDTPQAVWLVNSGQVKLVRLESEGQELIVNLCSAGQWICLASAIKEARYEFTAAPLTRCSLQRLPIGAFHRLLKTDPEFAGQITRALAGSILELYGRASQIASIAPRQQLEQYLWRISAEQGLNGNGGEVRLRLPLKRKEIAQMINVTPQYVSELLTELVDEGVLRRDGRDLIIVDRLRLRQENDFEGPRRNH